MAKSIENHTEIKSIKLPVAIKREDGVLEELEIRKPKAGHLRGLNLIELCEMKFEAGEKILPKITCLDEREVLNLDVANWAPILTTIAGFFVNTDQ